MKLGPRQIITRDWQLSDTMLTNLPVPSLPRDCTTSPINRLQFTALVRMYSPPAGRRGRHGVLPAQGGAAVAGGGCVRRQGAVGGGLGVRGGDGRRRQVVRGVVVEAGQVREGALGS